ncbi:hypothetical protein LNTAR_03744 [Lentisphaera araneosa HTCC2155]|jgi:hypothetical protein|uniref:3-keto-alpha-glucoside-1,2-lyase/3-keto-2-hydroxy-glucal hydratase domain-containing protein n=1 Tax=Lentisphaera araneosa HTCC2155 TaxID=313628 RepID=A6DTN0_9BACT|nr:family 16 glycoside hydrolase [Lentisphaera araneosa]EDM25010.1 hypothetical protein LNTAR_03744 [Lentisphaera araneosa HTCC2155]
MKVLTILILSLLSSCTFHTDNGLDLLGESKNWKTSNYGSGGEFKLASKLATLEMGDPICGMTWAGQELPKNNYQIELEAKRTQGNDFFVGLTFPIKEQFCSLIISGWGGTVTGLSSIDGVDASENETSCDIEINNHQWYKIKLVVSNKAITVDVDGKQIIYYPTQNRTFSIRPEVEPSKPLGLATFYTAAQYRNFYLKKLD